MSELDTYGTPPLIFNYWFMKMALFFQLRLSYLIFHSVILLGCWFSPATCIDSSIWSKYSKMMGEGKMLKSFESADVFGRSILTETQLTGRNHLSCFNYENGAAFAKEYDASLCGYSISIAYFIRRHLLKSDTDRLIQNSIRFVLLYFMSGRMKTSCVFWSIIQKRRNSSKQCLQLWMCLYKSKFFMKYC